MMIKKNKPYILYVVESLDNNYGGPARSVPSIALNIKRLYGIDSVLLSVSVKPDERNEVIDNSDLVWLKFKLNGPRKLMVSFQMIKKMLDPDFMCRFDIIHLNNLWNFPALISWYSAKKFKIPLIISPRGSLYQWSLSQGLLHKRIALILYQKMMLKQASVVHVTDKSEMEALKDLGINTKYIVIPNGINISRTMPVVDAADCILKSESFKGRKKILFIGRIHKKKGLDLLIASFSELFESFPDWDLHIIGEIKNNKYIDYLKKIISDKNGSNRIFFHGEFVGPKKIEIFRNSDLFVLPSHSENFGISVAEAMSNSLPVITTNNTPWKELGNINAGWSIDLSKNNLRQALYQAMSLDCSSLKAMGKNGRDYVERFDWKVISNQYNQMYLFASEKSKLNIP